MDKDPPAATLEFRNVAGPDPRLERYGRYSLIEQIGRGGMAEVFRAVAQGVEGFRRVFVIKRLRPEKSDAAEIVQMFCDEARLCALLHHPNIVQVYDFGLINGTYFLAMEYLRGKDLAAVMKALRRDKGAVSPPLAARIAHQVATGLYYAHTLTRGDGQTLQVVHRDVTPSNVMLQRTGVVKILDFGIAQVTNLARQADTGHRQVKGKLAYLSPEQVRLEELDGRSDVFALGVVLWEMLTGQRLFAADTDFATMRSVLTLPVPPPSSKRAEVPAALDQIVARALQRDRDKRYANAQEMADDLERFLQAVPCHSQALARLLLELFGEEAADHTPELPDLGPSDIVGAGPAATAGPSALEPAGVASEPVVEIDADEPPRSVTAALASVTDAPRDEVASSPRTRRAPLLDQRALVRRVVAGAAIATLLACFSWATWRGKRPVTVARVAAPIVEASPATAEPAAAAVPPAPPAADPGPEKAELAASPPSPARAPRKTPGARPPHRLSSDVTFDPFK